MYFKSENKTSIKETVFIVLALVVYFLIGGYLGNLFPTQTNIVYVICGALIISPALYYVLKKAS